MDPAEKALLEAAGSASFYFYKKTPPFPKQELKNTVTSWPIPRSARPEVAQSVLSAFSSMEEVIPLLREAHGL